MTGIIVVFPKSDDATNIRNLLNKNGFHVILACTTGAQALQQMDQMDGGIVVCGYKMKDMIYSDLRYCMPKGFEMLLVASNSLWSEGKESNLVCLSTPLKVHELVNTLCMMVQAQNHRQKKNQKKTTVRSRKDRETILKAKQLLMERNHMSEEEAHKYLQKCSMDNGNSMVETAQMVLSIF